MFIDDLLAKPEQVNAVLAVYAFGLSIVVALLAWFRYSRPVFVVALGFSLLMTASMLGATTLLGEQPNEPWVLAVRYTNVALRTAACILISGALILRWRIWRRRSTHGVNG